MKIYTYYENIEFNNQEELLRLWYFSWAKMGFHPVVLGIKDAQKHSTFDSFNKTMGDICHKMQSLNNTGGVNEKYVMSCHRRWLAYASQKPERFIVSDYDVINFHLKPDDTKLDTIKENKIHFLDGLCPCLAMGRPKNFENFALDLLTTSEQNIENNKKWTGSLYHDQQVLLHNEEYFRNSDKYAFYQNDFRNYIWTKLRHFSHHYVSKLKSMPLDNLRTQLIKAQLIIGT